MLVNGKNNGKKKKSYSITVIEDPTNSKGNNKNPVNPIIADLVLIINSFLLTNVSLFIKLIVKINPLNHTCNCYKP